MKLFVASFAVIGFAASLSAQTPATPATPAAAHVMGGAIMDAKMMSLYTFDNDKEANKSSCTGACITNWPAFKATATDKDMGDWKVITREDGTKQWAYKGKPLYYFAQDKNPGDKVGDGRGGVWHLAKP
jgi:predicted lipoprotein with Yx(FWY)xxD motif